MEPLLVWTGVGVLSLTLAWLFADGHSDGNAVPDITNEWVPIGPKDANAAPVPGPVMRGMIASLMLQSLDGASMAVVEVIVTNVQDETVDVHVRKLYDALGPGAPTVPSLIRGVLKGDLLKAAEA